MTTPTETVCQGCRQPITIDYVRLGTAVRCPHCREMTVPRVPLGGSYPNTGYQLSYQDFCGLIGNDAGRDAVGPLLLEWFGCRAETSGTDTLVRNADGIPVDTLWLHLHIQADPDRQGTLYRTAMTLWH